eukprot:gnl/MRDRNA2_/MRDRNA2_125861_c0_seq1.p1 gnl/MRDRNA2_/MRDRNA2_125861_c0~~gnl/MRDRNA2_/MRDRNA2_125861_c0_seq1.p1  ORF type:complete len:462 (-),score=79.27 gnl/MRDRNA2_/MRDRNA2_125861_c0_seq1:94-1479(-)
MILLLHATVFFQGLSADSVSGRANLQQFLQTPQDQKCVEPTRSSYQMSLASFHKTITVPPVSSNLTDFRYATDNAVVALPASCAQTHRASVDGVDIEDSEHSGMYLFRRQGPRGDLSDLVHCSSSAKGLVIILAGHRGSVGKGATQLYLRILSGLGFLAVALDGGADRLGMKGEEFAMLKGQNGGREDVQFYSNQCVDFSKPFCYTTTEENIVNNPEEYKQYMERVHLIRKNELDYFVETALARGAGTKSFLEAFRDRGKKIFLLGRSDGGVIASQYYHEKLHKEFLDGVMIGAFSCDFTYMNSCADHAKICQDRCPKATPLLAWISDVDPYFSKTDDSMASRIAGSRNGYGGEITGNCKAAFDTQGFSRTTSVLLRQSEHDEAGMYEDTIRKLLAEFTSSPESALGVPPDCAISADLYQCMSAQALKAEEVSFDAQSKQRVAANVSVSVKVAVDIRPHSS